jgi:GntR family transcriptional repressor for pyruvate dehydrogenase complex
MTTHSFSKLASESRADQVRNQLEAAIRHGDYPIGSKLPSERELTEMFGVSRVSVREGIRSLEAVGLVEVRHGDGCYVLDTTRKPRADLLHWLRSNRDEVFEMLLVRGALDEVAAQQAATRGTPAELAAVAAAHDAFLAAAETGDVIRAGDLDELVRRDITFHLAIADASGSGLLIDLLGELHQHLADARRAGFQPEGRVERAVREHSAILAALQAGDAVAARAAVATHISQVHDVLSGMGES